MVSCRTLLRHSDALAVVLARASAGKSSAASVAITTTTIISSTRVKPACRPDNAGEPSPKTGVDLIMRSDGARTRVQFRGPGCQNYVSPSELSKGNQANMWNTLQALRVCLNGC